jgi:antitoxin component YwqK of YwqJK toxin-antitoxin module
MIKISNTSLAFSVSIIFLLTACQKQQSSNTSEAPELTDESVTTSATDSIKETLEEVPYNELGYDKGLFMKDKKLFTGTSVLKHSNGKIGGRYQFVDGIYDGIVEEWYENGQRSAYKMYKDGMRHGITTYWDEEGKPTKQVLYKDDEETEVKRGDQIPKDLGI